MSTVKENEIIIDGKSEMIIAHSKNRILIELLFFIFWAAIGTALIVVGSILVEESLGLRIPSIVIGSLIIIIFFESFLARLTNKIILKEDEIKTRIFFSWESLPWSEIQTIEVEKRSPDILNSRKPPRITILKFFADGEEALVYPMFRFNPSEAEKIIDLIKAYFKANRGIELNEKIVNFAKGKNADEQAASLEEEIESQIPPKVEDYEVEDETP